MPPQQDPPAQGATPSVSVRRAAAVPGPDEDPGAAFVPRSADQSQSQSQSQSHSQDPGPGPAPAPDSAEVPAPLSQTPDPTPTPTLTPTPTPGPLRRWRSRSGSAEGVSASAEPEPEPERRQEAARQQASADGPDPEAPVGVLFAGNDDGGDDASGDASSPGRPRGPMLAAAGIAGAVLIAVPFLVLGMGDDDDHTVNAAPVGGTTLDPGLAGKEPAADYAADSPSPSASPSPAKSASPKAPAPKVRSAPRSAVKETPVAKHSAKPKPKTDTKKDAALARRQIIQALSNRGNAMLVNLNTGKCADLPNFGKGKAEGPVNQYICRSAQDNQLWDLTMIHPDGGPGGAPQFVIKNRQDGLCLDLPANGGVAQATKVQEYYCDTTEDNQLWSLESRSQQGYLIHNVTTDMCLGVNGGSSAGDDARLQVGQCSEVPGTAQHWLISSVV